MNLFIYIALGFLVFAALGQSFMILAAGLIRSDLLHNLEELKHIMVLNSMKSNSVDPETMAKFLNPTPVVQGDVKFHIPTSILRGTDNDEDN